MPRLRPPLNLDDLKVIFDVLNVYDPNDIQHVYPQMGEREFLDDVRIVWHKVLELIKEEIELDTCTKIWHTRIMKVNAEKRWLITTSNDGCVVIVSAEEKTAPKDIFISSDCLKRNLKAKKFIKHKTLKYNDSPVYVLKEGVPK